ncbi:MAG: hypothetical protein FWD34_01850 [Oscillospiraceae bacterium]|nr:hypothetical protein [Oscillospiraceae bacterium]
MRFKTLYSTKNGAYVYSTIMPDGGKPAGLFWHSTGADNPWVMRYAGDSTTKDTLIGANPNNNGFQQTTDKNAKNSKGETVPCPNAVMGLGTDGKMLTVKTLPDNYCPWCSGTGNLALAQKNGFSKNSANFLGFYQVEVCEDIKCTGTVYGRKNPYTPKEYADLCYKEMVKFSIEFFNAFFKGDPSKVTTRTLTSHAEASLMGIASNHADPWHWLGKYGYSGNTLRADVKKGLQNTIAPPPSRPLKVGDTVTITAPYATSAYAAKTSAKAAVGQARVITKIYSGAGVTFPYQLGVKPNNTSSNNTTGFAKLSGVKPK